MNKIYKVVWSKVKHCYVVTSELAKRQTKGCGARSLRTATVSLGVAAALLCTGAVLPIFGESVVEASAIDVTSTVYTGLTKYTYSYSDFYAPSSTDVTLLNIKSGAHEVGFAGGYKVGADVTGKSLTVTGDSVKGYLFGGWAMGSSGAAVNNILSITGGMIDSNSGSHYFGGGHALNGDTINNTVNVTGAAVFSSSATLYGGYAFNGDAKTNNSVNISGGTFQGNATLAGGWSSNNNATDNSVNISGGTFEKSLTVYGSRAYKVNVKGNSVTVSGGAFQGKTDLYGGYAQSAGGTGDGEANTVTVSGGTFNGNTSVYGGYAYSGVATGNKVNITGGTVLNAYGGYASNGSAVEANDVVINGGTIGVSGTIASGGQLYGAYSYNSSGNSGNVTGNTVTVKKGTVLATVYGGSAKAEGTGNQSGDATKNIVTIEDGTLAGTIYGGYSGAQYKTSGNVEGNQVEIKGGVLKSAPVTINGTNYNTDGVRYIHGGYAFGYDKDTETNASGVAKDNVLTISGGMFRSDVEVTGGYSNANNAEHNIVTLTDKFTGTVGTVKGGEAGGNGTATKNEVTITGGTSGNTFGGSSSGGVVGGDAAEDGNKVTINNATVNGSVYGGFNNGNGSTGAVKNNKVTITKGTVTGMIYGGYGSSSSGSVSDKVGDVSNNKVEIIGGKVRSVYGGENSAGRPEQSGKAEENTVSVSGNAELTSGIIGGSSGTIAANNHVSISGNSKVTGQVNGGRSGTSRTDYASVANATDNDVTISENAVLSSDVYGGYSQVAKAEGNVVTIKGGTVNYNSSYNSISGVTGNGVYGGFSFGSGDVLKNVVTIEGGNVNAYSGVYGGWTKSGTAGGTGADDGNKVTITGGTVSKNVYGGYSKTGAATGNTVSISDGTVSGMVFGGSSTSGATNNNNVTVSGGTLTDSIWGGDSTSGVSKYNVVIISGQAKIGGEGIIGGRSWNSDTIGNTVTISGGTFAPDAYTPYISLSAGVSNNKGASEKDNVVNLTGAVTGLGTVQISGYGSSATTHSGNELHIGGTKTYDSSGSATVSDGAIWQGKSSDGTVNNKVKSVSNFESIVLHNVAWSTTVPVLETTKVENVNTLDIKNLKFDKTPSSGESMALLKSGSDISSIKLTYNSGTNETITSAGIIVKDGSGEQTEATGVNGIKLTTKGGSEKVSLPDVNTILYSFEAGKVKEITFGTFDSGKEARDLSDSVFEEGNTIDAAGLSFADTASVLKKDDAITLVSKATGMVTSVTNGTGKTIGSKFTDDNKIQFTIEAKGDVTSTGTEVKYTVTGVTLKKVDLTNWNGTTSDISGQTSGWTLEAGETVTTGDLASADLSNLKPGDTKTILTASDSVVFTNDAIVGNKKWQAGGAIVDTAVNGVKVDGTTTGGGVKVDDSKANQLVYQQSKDNVTKVTLSGVSFAKDGTARAFGNAYDLTGADIDATGFSITNAATAVMNTNDEMVIVDAAKAILGTGGATLKEFAKQSAGAPIAFSDAIEGTVLTFAGTHQDTLEQDDAKTKIVYKVGDKNVTKATLNGNIAWNDSEAYYTNNAARYKFSDATTIDAAGLVLTGTSSTALKKGDAMTLLSAEGLTAGNTVTQPATASTVAADFTEKGIAFGANVTGEVKTAANAVKYEVTGLAINTVDIGAVEWQKGAILVDRSDASNNFAGVTKIGTGNFAMTIANPADVAADDSMTLLKANETLTAMVNETKTTSYNNYEVAPGVLMDGSISGIIGRSGNNVVFTAAGNKASQLTFTNVEWKDTLMTRPANIVFDGAKVVTTDIKFTNIDSQVAGQTMTLVQNFDGTPSAIEGDRYMVGSGRTGEGAAEMSGSNLIFRTKTGTVPTDATHETVMAMEAGTAVVAAGREFVDSAVEGLGLVSNMAPDGTSTFASMGGGASRYKTGSHIDTHTWSAVVAVGSKKEHKKGDLEWGVFAEYGRGNYTLHDDKGGQGDGDTHYAGGGLLAKWTNKHNVYTEASVRMGRMSDTAKNMLADRLGNSYGYDIDANYVGAHVGVGKILKVKENRDLDVYGKYFYLRRNGVNFDAGGNHYSLDSVSSSLLRVGARYGSNDKKWNWYGGLAYEYEFGGESKGTVDGLAIRAASIKGGSVRGEIGMRMEATKTNPWKVDIGVYGYGGKHRGFGGNVSVMYMF